MGADNDNQHRQTPRRVLRTATINRSGHTWRFVWSPGDEPAVIAAACAEARDAASTMRFADAAVLANKIARRAAEKQLAFVAKYTHPGDAHRPENIQPPRFTP